MPTREFFNVRPVAEALRELFTHLPAPRTETQPTAASLGRVLHIPPVSPLDLPSFPRSSMDGYAVRAADTHGASPALPAYLRCIGKVNMGEEAGLALEAGTCAEIATGAMMPAHADAVVMVERTQLISSAEIEVLTPVAAGENVVQVGEDVRAGTDILPAGHRLRAQDIGGLLGVGLLHVNVAAVPRIAILSSGDELVSPEIAPTIGQVRDINSYTLAALLQPLGVAIEPLGIARDTLDALSTTAQMGLARSDMLVLTAGSSVSSRDLTHDVIAQLGKPGILQHGLAVKPGKPTILAVCDGKPVIGLPGNPVSALLVARQIVLPIVRRLMGERSPILATIRATLTRNIASQSGREDTIPVKLETRNGSCFAEPIFGKSNLIYTLIAADGVIEIPLDTGGLLQGALVDVVLF